MPEETKCGVRISRLAEKESLAACASELNQPFGLGLVLDAFGDHIHAKTVAHCQNGADDVLGRPVVEDRRDEGSINLQLVEMKIPQAPKARLAGTEIVE